MRSFLTGSYSHIMPLLYQSQHDGNVRWIMLTVGIHKYNYITTSSTRTGFNRSAIPFGIRMIDHLSASLPCNFSSTIARPIINDKELCLRQQITQTH